MNHARSRGPLVGPLAALAAAAILVATPTPPAAGEALLVDRVAAVVGDGVVLKSDVMARAAPMLADVEGIADESERERRRADILSRVLDDMIDEELLVQAAGQANVSITDQEIDQAIAEVRRQNNLSEAEFEEALQTQGYTLEAYREDLEQQMLQMRATEMLVRPRVNVSEDDVRARYEEIRRTVGDVGRVELRHILIEVPDGAGEGERDEAREEGEELADRARGGEDFAELAQAHSDDPATRENGGRLGWFERGDLHSEWEELIFGMEPGEVEGPVSGPSGFHVFQLADREEDELAPFEDKAPELREELGRAEMERETERFVDDLRDRIHIDVKLER